jgi:hypothetical protein
MGALNLIKKIPISLRNEVWTAFIDSIAEELEMMNNETIKTKEALYNTDEMDYDRLIEISDLLGVVFDASINDSLDFLRREVQAIPFKIKYKSTVRLYLSFFRSLGRSGGVFIYYFKASSDALVRNSQNFLLNAHGHTPTIPFFHPSSDNFSGFVENVLKLDSGLVLDVENEGEIWTLDTVDSSLSTNHIGLEFFIDRIITKDFRDSSGNLIPNKEFLMTWEYMDFIQVNTSFSRRVKEVPHVGAQLTAICDSSKTINPLDSEYSIPALKLKALTTDAFADIESFLDLSYMEFGIGTHENLPTKEALVGEVMPTSLALRVARNYCLFDEKYDDATFMAAIAEYRGQQINRFALHDGTGYLLEDPYGSGVVDGVNNNFQGTLLFAPVQKGNIRFVFTEGGLEREILDDQKGNLTGEYAYGTVDYSTGQYYFSTDIEYRAHEVAFTGDGVTQIVNYSITLPSPVLSDVNNEVWVRYNVGGRTFVAKDDGAGNILDISGGYITTATVDYTTAQFYFEFSEPLTDGTLLELDFQYQKVTTPDINTEIRADYYFTIQSIEITEAGLFDQNNNMVAYATFPPVEFSSTKNHLNMGFLISKDVF